MTARHASARGAGFVPVARNEEALRIWATSCAPTGEAIHVVDDVGVEAQAEEIARLASLHSTLAKSITCVGDGSIPGPFPPPLALAKAFSRPSCGWIFLLFSRVMREGLSTDVFPADIQDRHAAIDLLKQARSRFPFIERIYAEGGYSCWKIEIVKRSDAHRCVVLP